MAVYSPGSRIRPCPMRLSVHQLQFVFLAVVQFLATAAYADTWPRLRGEDAEPCQEAPAIGRQANSSTHRSLLAPSQSLPATVRSVRVLGVDEYDISGGDAIATDASEFEKM